VRAHRPSALFPFLANSLLLVAITLAVGCNPPAATDDAAVLPDTGPAPIDGGHDAFVRPDAGPLPLCSGTGCELVGIELMSESTCVVRGNGQVDCWGRAQEGELGDTAHSHGSNCRMNAGENDTDCSPRAVTVAFASAPSAIFTRGTVQGCGLVGAAHEVWCWGSQQYKLGATLEHSRLAPEHVMVDGVAVADGATQIALSYGNLCWIAADTTVQCLGAGSSGRLGNGAFSDTTTPSPVMLSGGTPLMGALEIDQQNGHACARTADHLYCWGNNQFDQIGSAGPHQTCIATPTMYDCSNVAVEVTGVTAATIIDIQLGDSFSCVLHSTGHVQCWGGGQGGGLGNGDLHSTALPVEPTGLSNVAELRVVDGDACALLHDGSVMCWGAGNQGQIGDGQMSHAATPCVDGNGAPYDCQLTPTMVPSLSGVAHIGLGEGHACALLTSGEVWCWGASLRYQLGDQMRPTPQYAPVRVTALGS